MCAEIEIADDFRAQHAGNIGSRGCAAAGRNLFRDAATANDFTALENEC